MMTVAGTVGVLKFFYRHVYDRFRHILFIVVTINRPVLQELVTL